MLWTQMVLYPSRECIRRNPVSITWLSGQKYIWSQSYTFYPAANTL